MITIVVLLILAGVSISMLTGDNAILTQAQNAKNKTEEAEKEEKKILDSYEQYINASKNETIVYKDENGDTATIPAGFSVSIEDDEQTIDDGLVVKAPDESEFVWVPVDDINTMAQCKETGGDCNLQLQSNGTLKCVTHNSTEIVGKLYATDAGENFGTVNTKYSADSGLREPAVIVGNKDGDEYDAEYYSVAGFSSIDDMLTQLKNEYKIMAESVAKYKGFYISRYEISFSSSTETIAGTTGNIQSKANVMPASATSDQGNMWYGFYKLQKEYSNLDKLKSSNIGSSMIWGSQYDAMINWANTGKDANKTKENTNGNHSKEKSYTGEYVNDKINNIYDLEGNLFEYTLESHFWGAKVSRGSCFNRGPGFANGEAQSPSARYLVSPSWAYSDQGSRMTLYIK